MGQSWSSTLIGCHRLFLKPPTHFYIFCHKWIKMCLDLRMKIEVAAGVAATRRALRSVVGQRRSIAVRF